VIRTDRAQLAGRFCRGCGYCLPCPAGIPISTAARMSLLLRRSPPARFMEDQWRRDMDRIRSCTGCGACRKKCPYGLDTPELLRENLRDYEEFCAGRVHDAASRTCAS